MKRSVGQRKLMELAESWRVDAETSYLSADGTQMLLACARDIEELLGKVPS